MIVGIVLCFVVPAYSDVMLVLFLNKYYFIIIILQISLEVGELYSV
jgi:hypothetical protein